VSDDARISAWIERARRGDEESTTALGQYVHDLARQVCRSGSGAALGGADWEDVAQEAAVRVFSSGLERYQGTGSARGYLYSIVKASLLQTIRSARRRRAREESAEIPPVPSASPSLDPHEVAGLLDRLEDECRTLLEQVFFEGVAYGRLAEESGLAESSIRARVSRCLRRLRETAE
jgi:RNA polymerase sigma factor (sigma-70 family)